MAENLLHFFRCPRASSRNHVQTARRPRTRRKKKEKTNDRVLQSTLGNHCNWGNRRTRCRSLPTIDFCGAQWKLF